jgi:hypothetical protein
MTVYGDSIFKTTVPDRVLGDAIHDTVQQLGAWQEIGPNQRRLPSFKGGSSNWKNAAGVVEAARGRTEFLDKAGNTDVIQTVSLTGEPTLVLLDSQGQQGSMTLFNTLSANLTKRASEQRKSARENLLGQLSDSFAQLSETIGRGDLAGAQKQIGPMIKGADGFMAGAAGSPAAPMIGKGIEMLKRLEDALKKNDLAGSKRIVEQLNKLGPEIERLMSSTQPAL